MSTWTKTPDASLRTGFRGRVLAIDELMPAALKEGKGLQALDVGCGIGLLGRLYPSVGWVGLDASITLLRKADTGYRLLIEGTAEQLPFADAAWT